MGVKFCRERKSGSVVEVVILSRWYSLEVAVKGLWSVGKQLSIFYYFLTFFLPFLDSDSLEFVKFAVVIQGLQNTQNFVIFKSLFAHRTITLRAVFFDLPR